MTAPPHVIRGGGGVWGGAGRVLILLKDLDPGRLDGGFSLCVILTGLVLHLGHELLDRNRAPLLRAHRREEPEDQRLELRFGCGFLVAILCVANLRVVIVFLLLLRALTLALRRASLLLLLRA